MRTKSNCFDSDDSSNPKTISEAVTNKSFCTKLARKLPKSRMSVNNMLQEVIARGLEAEENGHFDPSKGSPLRFLLGIGWHVRYESIRGWYRSPDVGINLDQPDDKTPSPLNQVIFWEDWDRTLALIELLEIEDRALIYRRYGFCGSWDQQFHPMNSSERCRLCRLLAGLRQRLSDDE
jgi:hypothetical protein